MSDVDVPDEFDDWPFDARSFVLAEANTTVDLRHEVEALAGMERSDDESDGAGQFTKEELATLVMALGGPRGDDS